MEDTGYMARIAFIVDKIMHKIGLHGRSFIPMLMGFGCNVPAIMATRTIGSKNDRLVTMLINPFMSCSARLPIYVLIIGAVFPEHPGLMLFTIYGIGILLSIIIAIIFKKTLFKSKEMPFVMELPPYRMPTIKSILKHTWFKGSQYLRKMGGIILIASIIIWCLQYFPRFHENDLIAEQQISQSIEKYEKQISVSNDIAEQMRLTKGLMQKLQQQTFSHSKYIGQKVFTQLTAFGFLIFILVYFPCIAVIATIRRESGGWKWALFMATYTTLLAYILALAIHQIGILF